MFGKRGTGLSGSVSIGNLPGLEQRMDDVRAVREAAGSEGAAVFGASEGGNLSVLFAATYPERVRALVLAASFARRIRSPEYPWAPTPEELAIARQGDRQVSAEESRWIAGQIPREIRAAARHRCACAISAAVGQPGPELRAGLHTGECEPVDGKVRGIDVHIGARVAHGTGPGEVLVSSTVKDLVAGSGLRFPERKRTELKGVPGDWQLYLVEGGA